MCPVVVVMPSSFLSSSRPPHRHRHRPASSSSSCIVVILHRRRPALPSPPGCCRHSTRYPPHEQLLMRLGAGGVSFLVRRCRPLFVAVSVLLIPPLPPSSALIPLIVSSALVPLIISSALVCPRHLATPPLSALVCRFKPLLIPSSSHNLALSSSAPFHPRSTARAVAREAGGGWCVVCHLAPFGWASSR